MFSLTIHFGPSSMAWALLFKEEEKAGVVYNAYMDFKMNAKAPDWSGMLIGSDDFGQSFAIPMEEIRGMMLEDLELVEEARIFRALANARADVKARQRAMTDPVIRQGQQGPAVLQPMGGRFNG